MPITIAICDDNSQQITYLRRILTKWSADKPIALHINEYESAEGFLFDYPDNPCDLLLLDIEMKGINGMELAKKLRCAEDMLPIIFITGFSEYLSDGYDVEALHYLLKPVSDDKLFAVLDRYIAKCSTKSTEILITSGGNASHISVDKIIFAEAFGHKITLHLSDGDALDADISISEFADKCGKDFVLCHRSYIVNLRYIKSIGKTEICFDNGRTIPLSRRLYSEVNSRFIDFYMKGYSYEK